MRGLPEMPLLRREVVGLLRTRRAFWLVVSLVVISGILPLTFHSSYAILPPAQANRLVFGTFLSIQLVLLLLFVPAFTAGAVSGEREKGTLELVQMTLIRPSSIAFAKVAAATVFVLVLLLACAPLTSIAYVLGGIDFATIAECYALTIAATVSSAVVSLAVSARSERTATAAVRSVVWVAFWYFGLYLLAGLVCNAIDGFTGSYSLVDSLAALVFGISPFPAILVQLVEPGFSRGVGASGVFLIYAGLLAGAHLLLLLLATRKPEVRSAPRRRSRRRSGPPRRPFLGRVFLELGDAVRLGPVFRKEVLSATYGKRRYRFFAFWLTLGLCALIFSVARTLESAVGFTTTTAFVLVALVVPAASAGSIPGEIERQSLDLLRGTQVSAGEFVAGKLFGAVYSGAGILIAGAGMILLGGILKRPERLVPGLVVIAVAFPLFLLYLAALSTVAGALARRTVTALVLAYLAEIGIFALAPFVIGVGGGSELSGWVTPFGMIAGVIAPWVGERSFPHAWNVFGGSVLVSLVGVGSFWGVAAVRASERFFGGIIYHGDSSRPSHVAADLPAIRDRPAARDRP